MILIVVDTGPINYLIQIGHIDLLSTLADKTVLPSSVRAELLNDAAPANFRAWAANPPGWVEIHAAKQVIGTRDISGTDREAIALARELNASFLLMDDQQARRCASALDRNVAEPILHRFRAISFFGRGVPGVEAQG